ncbi:MAG: DUF1801 domain-containing protein [Pirellula sp.]|jgi:hypothetical protein
MQSKASTVDQYIEELTSDRQEAISAVRKVILKNIDPSFQETMQYGMIGYSVPHSLYPAGYHCDPKQPLPFAGLASQKNYMSLYLISAYNDTEFDSWIRKAFEKVGKKLDMGKCCIRFKKLEDLPMEIVAEAFRRVRCSQFVESYEAFLAEHRSSKPTTKKTTKTSTKKTTTKKATTKKVSSAKKVATPKKTTRASAKASAKVTAKTKTAATKKKSSAKRSPK